MRLRPRGRKGRRWERLAHPADQVGDGLLRARGRRLRIKVCALRELDRVGRRKRQADRELLCGQRRARVRRRAKGKQRQHRRHAASLECSTARVYPRTK